MTIGDGISMAAVWAFPITVSYTPTIGGNGWFIAVLAALGATAMIAFRRGGHE